MVRIVLGIEPSFKPGFPLCLDKQGSSTLWGRWGQPHCLHYPRKALTVARAGRKVDPPLPGRGSKSGDRWDSFSGMESR